MLRFPIKALLLTAVLASAAHAVPMTYDLADLISNAGSFTVGDKQFSDFSFTFATRTCAPGVAGTDCTYTPASPLAANALTILTLDSDPFGFQLLGGIATTAAAGSLSTFDVLFQYTVTVLNPNLAISAIQQQVTATSTVPGGLAIVKEDAVGPGGVSTAKSVVTIDDFADPTAEVFQGDKLTFLNGSNIPTPVTTARITKDIFLQVTGGTVVISNITQRFEQVPEPAGLAALLGAGLLALLAKKRASSAA